MQELTHFQKGFFPAPNTGTLKHKGKKKFSRLNASEKLGHQWEFNCACVLKNLLKIINLE